jgi:hypothetical protein
MRNYDGPFVLSLSKDEVSGLEACWETVYMLTHNAKASVVMCGM